MRPFEELLLASTLLICLLLQVKSLRKAKNWRAKAYCLLLFTCITQIVAEEARWQMFPAYLAVLLLGCAISIQDKSKSLRTANFSLFFGLLGLLLSSLVPIARLPAPSGPYHVGTQTRHLVDSSRAEVFSANPEQKRELPVQIWYPAKEPVKPKFESYMQSTSDYRALIKAPLPSVLASHLHLIPTHSIKDASVASFISTKETKRSLSARRFPVIIFSHGLMGGRIQNTIQCEELCSHGYVVLAVDHPYDASFAIFPDGKTICSQLLTGIPSPAHGPTLQKDGFDLRIQDLIFVLNWLHATNNDPKDLLGGSMDLESVGVMGHSFGGASSLFVSALDHRIKAAIDMDGSTIGIPPANKPVLIMHADHAKEDRLGSDDYARRQKGEMVNIQIQGTGHANFTDLPMLTPLHGVLLLSGSIHPARCEEILNEYSLDFFDHYLKQKGFRIIRSEKAMTDKHLNLCPEVTYLNTIKQ